MSHPDRQKISFTSSMTWLHWLVVLLSLSLTLIAWQISSRIATDRARLQFEFQVEQLNEVLLDRMRNYAFALVSGVGAIQSHKGEMDRQTWRVFSESLAMPERLPGINGIGVIYRVPADRVAALIDEQRQTRPGFRVYPPHGNQDYWPIVYIEPEVTNQAAIGLDMAHETNRYQAALQAMNSGQTQITGPIVLVQDEAKTPGFLFFQPFYETGSVPPKHLREAQFKGLVYAPFIMSRLMQGALADTNRLIHLRIQDGGSILYDELTAELESYDASPMFSKTYSLDMYGRTWTFNVQTTQLFEIFSASKQPSIILGAGLLIDCLIVLVFFLLTNAKRQAEENVASKTAELRENLHFIESLTDNLPLVVAVWDESLSCRFINASGERFSGISKQEAIGKPLHDFIGFDQSGQFRSHHKRAIGGEAVTYTVQRTDPSGDERIARVHLIPIIQQGQQCFVSIVQDITEVTHRENQLKKLNRDLEMQTREAEKAVAAKAAFLANMSHEIRTPMNAIIGMLVLLLETNLSECSRTMAKKAFSASETLLQLLNDILDLSKIESEAIEIEERLFGIDTLLQRTAELFVLAAEEKGLKLRVLVQPDVPLEVYGDLHRWTQVLINLIGNALKFTADGEISVHVSFEARSERSGRLKISVIDSGIGVKVEDQNRIFENFKQADESTSRAYGGTGLGLAISKGLTERMGGELSLTSVYGEGSTFTVDVPLKTQDAPKTFGQRHYNNQAPVFYYGFRRNLDVLRDYAGQWRIACQPVDSLKNGLRRISGTVENDSAPVLMIDMEGADSMALEEAFRCLVSAGDQSTAERIVLLAAAGYTSGWLADFIDLGGVVINEPLTPSKLYDSFTVKKLRKFEADKQSCDHFTYPGLNVLIVDDLPLNCEIVESYLRKLDVLVTSVHCGSQALEQVALNPCDLIFMDLHLDGETGQEIAERIRKLHLERQPVIVALSASVTEQDRASAKKSGMEDYLTKPVLPADIQRVLQTFYGCKRQTNAIQSISPAPAPEALPDCISPQRHKELFSQLPQIFVPCLQSFSESGRAIRSGMAALRAEANAEELRKLAHRLKGAAGNIADVELQAAAARIEVESDDQQVLLSSELLQEQLDEHLYQINHFLERATRVINDVSADKDDLLTTFSRVRERVKSNRAVNQVDAKQLIDYLNIEQHQVLADRLQRSIAGFDFKIAQQVISEIEKEVSFGV